MITSTVPYKKFKFPVGELQINLDPDFIRTDQSDTADVDWVFQSTEELVELMLLCDALKRTGYKLGTLALIYVPFSRQDRVNHPGECFSLSVFATVINALGFETVRIDDPHSDVTPALIHNTMIATQAQVIVPLIEHELLIRKDDLPFYLVSPDAGALKKIYKVAESIESVKTYTSRRVGRLFCGVVEAGKQRNTATGEITGTVVYTPEKIVPGHRYYIIDDICDGGRTFIELGKAIKRIMSVEVELFVTHGFFTKGKDVFKGTVDHVHAVHDYTKE